MAYDYPRTMPLFSHTTCLVESNNATPRTRVEGRWGLPAMRITFKNHPDDLKIMNFILKRQKEIMKAGGAQKFGLARCA